MARNCFQPGNWDVHVKAHSISGSTANKSPSVVAYFDSFDRTPLHMAYKGKVLPFLKAPNYQ